MTTNVQMLLFYKLWNTTIIVVIIALAKMSSSFCFAFKKSVSNLDHYPLDASGNSEK